MTELRDSPHSTGTTSSVVLRIAGLRTHLNTRDGVVRAVDGVDLEVKSGETLGLVGESGSGKSMTARSIMGMLPTTGEIVSGEIWLDGEDLVQKTESEMNRVRGLKIAMIPQDPTTSLNPVYRIGDQLKETLRRLGPSSKAEMSARMVELLRGVKVADPEARLRDYPHQMSGGMKQRVVGAMAIAGEPRVLIADEPTTALDATVQLQYLELLRQLQKRTGTAIIYITHDFGIVARMCDRVAVMYAGKIVEAGSVRAVFDRPAHPYTAALIASLPELDADVAMLPAIKGRPPEPLAPPSGCSFAPRCSLAHDPCQEVPPNVQVAPNHSSQCWLAETGS